MYLRLSPYSDVLQAVLTNLQISEGIIKITGKSGAGKTALCSQLFHELEHNGQPAVFFLKAPASATALQNDILDNLKLDPSGNFTRTLTAWLTARAADNKPLVLIFDDAQQLDPQTFSAIRMLCNIQDQSRTLIRVILCGTEELDAKLSGPALRAVTQFLSQSVTLPYLTQEQVKDFCQGYWMLMGEEMKPLGDKALQKLFQETRGHPGILHARLNQGTTGAEKSDRHREADSVPVRSKPYRYAGQRKGWVPALLIIAGLLVLGGAGAYFALVPGATDDAVAATAAPAPDIAEPTPAAVPEVTAPVAQTSPVAEPPPAEPAPAPESTELVVMEARVVATAVEETVAAGAEADAESAPAQTEPAELPAVEDFIAAWTGSWQRRDVEAYLAHYHADFTPAQGTQDEWREQRRRVIGNASDIMISTEPPESIADAPDGGRFVRFWLGYSTPTYADRTLKELWLVPVNGAWRILAESNLRTERP